MRMYLLKGCSSGGVYAPCKHMPGGSYRRRLRSLLLYLCCVFRALISSLVCVDNSLSVCVTIVHCSAKVGH